MKNSIYLKLHILLLIYSFTNILSKIASNQTFLSFNFCICYLGILLLLFLYAICWQQLIKIIDLTKAYANKSINVVWGILWGILFFNEKISLLQIFGAILIIAGIIIFSLSDVKDDKNE